MKTIKGYNQYLREFVDINDMTPIQKAMHVTKELQSRLMTNDEDEKDAESESQSTEKNNASGNELDDTPVRGVIDEDELHAIDEQFERYILKFGAYRA